MKEADKEQGPEGRAAQQLQGLVDNSYDLVAFLSSSCEILSINEYGKHLSGYEDDSCLQSKSIFGLFAPECHDILREQINNAREEGCFESVLPILNCKSGERLPVRLIIFRVGAADDSEAGFGVIGRDLSELKSIAGQLSHSQKMDCLGQLTGGIAHDFNNMLVAIIGSMDLLARKVADDNYTKDDLEKGLDRISKAGKRAAALTRQLLAFSRKDETQIEIVEPNRIILAAHDLLKRVIPKSISISLKLASDVYNVCAEPSHLEQIVTNLAINARDAMPIGGMLTIETSNVILDKEYKAKHPEASEGPHLLLQVSDTGIGMREETLKNVFQPFFTTKESGKGTGLGLASVQGIVQRLGGHICVDSIFGEGSTFKVYFPATQVEATANGDKHVKEIEGGKETLLLCEDEEIVRTVLSQMLSSYGYKVLEAENSELALQIISKKASSIDLLISDVFMPETSGVDLADIIIATHPHIKILLISGHYSSLRLKDEMQNAVFLEKPFSVEDLLSNIRSLLDS